jgi:two-component system, OmpR family, sensor histidine kinase TctE
MNDERKRPPSIRHRLLIFLISSLLLMICGAAVVTYSVAVRSTNNAYDRSLLDPAFDIADNVSIDAHGAHVDLPQKALEALVYDQVDKVIFQVRSPANAIIDGVTDLPSPPAFNTEQFQFFDSTYRGEKIRVAALHAHNGFVVQVAETLHKRNRLVGEILAAELVPAILIAVASIALAWFGVARGLVPLEHLRSELDARAPRDLRPLAAKNAPAEIAPVINAFNGLLEHLREANLLQQRFLANAAHQLRTPLSGLQMHLELLLRHELPETVKAEVERMHTATVRASRLANQLLALAKAESAADEGQGLELMDLKSVADGAARDWAMTAHEQKIDLGFALDRAVMLGDPLLLPELVDNLIDNALRYTPRGGSITVSTGCVGDIPFLKVEDNGPGIPPAERGKVVERFYRIAGTPGEGSGLGLSIVQEVVDRHGGKLEISSSSEHGGTSITVSFPRTQAKDREASVF